MKTCKNRLIGLTMRDLSRSVVSRRQIAKDMQTHPDTRTLAKGIGVVWFCRPSIASLRVLLAILIARREPSANQAIRSTWGPVKHSRSKKKALALA
jgi:hypothetical protein